MGASMVLPDQSARLKKTVKSFALRGWEMAKLWAAFQRLDKQRIGKIRAYSIFEGPELKTSVLCGTLFALLDIEVEDPETDEINFGEFVHCIVTLCCFEPQEVLRFCMFAYDPEKNGHIEVEDFKALMNSLHGIIPPEKATGNIKASWLGLRFPENNKIEIEDIQSYHAQAPQILEPAFRWQHLMAVKYGGVEYWEQKKRRLFEDKLKADVILAKKKAKREKKQNFKKIQKIKKNMGILRYYCCPCIRFMYDPDDERGMTEEQIREKHAKKRDEELRAKNPDTAHWKQLEKKIDPNKGGSESYVVEKILKTERHREARSNARAERRAERKHDDSLAHKYRTMGEDVEMLI